MIAKIIISTALLWMGTSNGLAQTVSYLLPEKKACVDTVRTDSLETVSDYPREDFSHLSAEELQELIGRYERYIFIRDSLRSRTPRRSSRVFSYRDWQPRELNLQNLMEVATEMGLSNKLFVLAQAVLETGNFSSRVCREDNNLFGLYDSQHKEYFRFARWEDSVVGYGRMIQNRYRGGNYLDFLRRIGYAEDPQYIYKVAKTARELYQRMFEK